jgi:hypothetical protein
MYGVGFIKASNTLVAANAEFMVGRKKYQWVAGPYGQYICEWDGHAFVKTRRSLLSVLPKNKGVVWTEQLFVVAVIFFGEGYDKGWFASEREHFGQEKL